MISKKIDSPATTPTKRPSSIFVGHCEPVSPASLKLKPGFQSLMEKTYGQVGSSYNEIDSEPEHQYTESAFQQKL